jgi:NADH:ubiquinone oxidoreductase subunit H
MKRILLLALCLAGCASSTGPDAAIRDVRPLKLQRGEKILIEASSPLLKPGAPTTITFDTIKDVSGQPLKLDARATSAERALADVDERVETLLGNLHVIGKTTVTVEQTVDGKAVAFKSDAREPFDMDFFPHNLLRKANKLAARVSDGNVREWLGFEAKAGKGGVEVTSVAAKFEPDDLLHKCDQPPLDSTISAEEAKKCGLADAEFAKYDHDKDKSIAHHELEDWKREDGLAAQAGLKTGDLIVKAEGKPVATPAELEAAWTAAAEKVSLDVQRAGAAAKVELPTAGKPDAIPSWLILALALALVAGLVALPVPLIAGLVVVWERKVSGYMQSRLGPNRVGPGGWLQWLADGLKLLMKEDIVPTDADPYLFKASPYLAFIGLFLTFLVLPFSHYLIVSDLNIGLLFLLSVTSLVVVSIIMGGWSSNSKWSLLGGMRSAAQIISYELPASVALLSIATITGSLSTQKIIEAQGGAPWHWYLFRNPFTFAGFFIWFISALAEGNRTPFDLPEAESELVSGYNTEYSGFRFSLFPMVEWVNLFVIGAAASMLFLGGWRVPFVSQQMIENNGWWDLLGFVVFLAKDIAIIFVIIWIRWTLPRFRVDQMMNLCWKYFIPTSFACFLGAVAWSWLAPRWADFAMRYIMFAVFGLAFTAWFISRVLYNRRQYSDLVLNEKLGKANS